MNAHRNALIVVTVAALLATGCPSTTQIRTKPAGAQIVMDNTIKLGRTPIEYEEMVWVWTNRRFEARMPGYETTVFQIEKDYPWGQNLALCLCTGFILWPIVFASGYVPQTLVELRPSGQAFVADGIDERFELSFDSSL